MTAVLYLVPLAAVAVLVAMLSALLVAAGFPLWRPRSARVTSSAVFAALALLPVSAGGLAALALASPDPYSACHCVLHGLHHPHLCASHAELAGPLFAPCLAVLLVWLGAAAPGLATLARQTLEAQRIARAARTLAVTTIDGVEIRVHPMPMPGAFTGGLLAPVVSVDPGLLDALPVEERRAVVHHEHAHVLRRDGLTLWALRLAVALFPAPGRGRLVQRWREAAEAACDRHAASQVDEESVASALLSVARLCGRPAPGSGLEMGMAGRADLGLERRVHSLLQAEGRVGAPLANDLLAIALVVIGLMAVTLAWPGDAVHHALETVIGLALR